MQVREFFEPIGMFHRNFPWAPVYSVLSSVLSAVLVLWS
eukprot:COSAG02_NODE_341_length_24173_cov_28.504777_15_plen_39_part_00